MQGGNRHVYRERMTEGRKEGRKKKVERWEGIKRQEKSWEGREEEEKLNLLVPSSAHTTRLHARPARWNDAEPRLVLLPDDDVCLRTKLITEAMMTVWG